MALQKTPLLHFGALELLRDQFNNNFNSYLQDVDHEYTDGLSLEPIDQTSVYISDKFQTLTPPACYILTEPMDINYSTDPNYLTAESLYNIVITLEDMGADVLELKAFRYARALFAVYNLIDLVTADQRLRIRTLPARIGYGDTIKSKLSQEGQIYRKDCVLELKVKHFEKNII
ncbi:MAG: hypothetical protein IPQ08_06200 [Chitinophagaceae bacterium]|nr:hypothetical protein [Chitinophagaceae bacterium]